MCMKHRHAGCGETGYHWNRNVLAGDEAEKGKMVSEKILKEMRKVALRLQDSRTFQAARSQGKIEAHLLWPGMDCRCGRLHTVQMPSDIANHCLYSYQKDAPFQRIYFHVSIHLS